MALAERFGGGPAYWLNPELPDELIETAIYVATRKRGQRK